MMPTGPTHPRMRGVGHAPIPAQGNGAPRTVTAVVPMEQFAIFYNDENGTPRANVLVKVGDALYLPPNGVEWAANLKPAAEWLKKAALPKIGNTEGKADPLPKNDAVDVMGGQDGEDDADDSPTK